ncbi:MAG TPA: DbpA RNA binding domain-containing protein [Gemmatimonadales bacterium]|nr:DbpA RNA binding domain-containing protein [Gemmatimonadales bacterium]
MTDLEQLHLTDPVADALTALGWAAEDPRVRDAAPTAARGHNLVVLMPPGAAHAGPALAGLASRLAAGPVEGPVLLLCPGAELDGWGGLMKALLRGTQLRLEVARGAARAARRLKAATLDVLVTTPETAAALAARGTLKGESLGAIVIAGPDRWPDRDVVTPLMQDLPKERQRILLVSAPDRVEDLVDRYARKALVLGLPPAGADAAPAGPVRTVAVAWERRPAALADLLEVLDPRSLVVWTADRSQHGAIAGALPAGDSSIRVVTGDAPKAELVVAFDPPDAGRLRQLLEAGQVVLLVPPGTESHVERIAAPRRPLRLPGPVDEAADAAAGRRAAVAQAVEARRSDAALLALAPLFERYDATAVAAAVYDLWVAAAAKSAPAAPAAPAGGPTVEPATAKIFVGVGRTDGATPSDLVAILTKELKVAREKIGRIELREGYSLVELPAQEAERIASALNGITIRRKRVVARVDRGPARPPARAPRRTR